MKKVAFIGLQTPVFVKMLQRIIHGRLQRLSDCRFDQHYSLVIRGTG